MFYVFKILYTEIHTDVHGEEAGITTQDSDITEHTSKTQVALAQTQAALTQTKNILTSTTKSTKAFLSVMADKNWWQGTITAFKQPMKRQISERQIVDADRNVKFEKQGCHPFYEGSIDPCYSDVVSCDLFSSTVYILDIC